MGKGAAVSLAGLRERAVQEREVRERLGLQGGRRGLQTGKQGLRRAVERRSTENVLGTIDFVGFLIFTFVGYLISSGVSTSMVINFSPFFIRTCSHVGCMVVGVLLGGLVSGLEVFRLGIRGLFIGRVGTQDMISLSAL